MEYLRADITKERVLGLYNRGYSISNIARVLDSARPTARRRLLEAGIPLGGKRKLNMPQLKIDYERGLTIQTLMQTYACSKNTIEENLIKAGAQIRHRGDKSGPDSHHWKGGRHATKGGYILLYAPEHPRASQKYVYEHILVWEQHHKRLLPDGWLVHHLNGVPSDNHPGNLVGKPKGKHSGKVLLLEVQKKLREVEIQNRQLQRALESNQSIFYINEN